MKKNFIKFKWSLAIPLLVLVWVSIEKWLGMRSMYLATHPYLSILLIIPSLTIYFFALREIKFKIFQNKMTFQKGLMCGMQITLIMMVITPILIVFVTKVISPSFFVNAINFTTHQQWFTEEKAIRYFNLKTYLGQAIMGTFFTGIICSICSSFYHSFPKKNLNN